MYDLRPNSYDKRNLKGIGGWLAFLAFTLLMNTAMLAVSLMGNILSFFTDDTLNKLLQEDKTLIGVVLFEIASNLLIFVFAAICIVLMFLKKANTRKWLLIFFLTNIGYAVIDNILNIAFGYEINPDASRALLISCLWLGYVLRSKRLKNTFEE